MRFSTVVCALASACAVAARSPRQLRGALKPDAIETLERRQHAVRDAAAAAAASVSDATNSTGSGSSPYLTDKTRKFRVDGSKIPDVDFNIGESYAGLLPIAPGKQRVGANDSQLYFWFFPSKNPAASNEILIWLNGGPGCSSLEGLIQENGPFLWQYGTYKPQPNPWTWTNLTNVVWIEQPVGTGFSRGTPTAKSEFDVAHQFMGFWQNFMDTFALQGRKVYITGESYAGMYVPHIAHEMLKAKNKTYYNVEATMIYDPSINSDAVMNEVPAFRALDANKNIFALNQTFYNQMKSAADKCGYNKFLDTYLTYPPKGKLPSPPSLNSVPDGCEVFYGIFNAALQVNPCWDVYEITTTCPLLWDVLGFPGSLFYQSQDTQIYFDRDDVKRAINAPIVPWAECAPENVYNTSTGLSTEANNNLYSSLTVLPYVIENSKRTVIGHGLLDFVLLSNGTLLSIQNMTWNGKQGFQQPITDEFYVPYHTDYQLSTIAGAGVMGRTHTERGLTYVEVSLSGHMEPQYAPSSSYRHLEFLLGRVSSLTSKQPFTSSNQGYPAQPPFVQDAQLEDVRPLKRVAVKEDL